MAFVRFQNFLVRFFQALSPSLRRTLFFFVVFLMGNLSAFADFVFHPRDPYLDSEHVIVGAISAFFTAILLSSVFLYTRLLEKSVLASRQSEAEFQKAAASAVDEKLRSEAIIAAIGDSITIQDRSHTILYQNEVHRKRFGDHVGERCHRAYRSRDEVCGGCAVKLAFEDGGVHRMGYNRETGGAIQYYEITAAPIRDSRGAIATAIEVVRDVSEQKRMEAELIESERRFRSIFETVNLVAVTLDRHGLVTYCNEFLLELTGRQRSEVLGRNWFDVFLPAEEREQVREIFAKVMLTSTVPSYHENNIISKSGERRLIAWYNTVLFDAHGAIVGIASLGDDITKRRHAEDEKSRLETQLRQAQKMEAVGQLAGGVAHDFNNILTAITGYGSLIRMKMKKDDPLRREVEHILASSERAARLTRSLLAYSRKQIINPKPVDLNRIVQGIERLLMRLIGEDIELTARLTGGELIVMADAGQIEQVLMNLATNARDAMPGHGALLIETGAVMVAEADRRPHYSIVPGRYAQLCVTDTGTGMDEKTRERIFDPFFTTKEVGKGTGLGLAMVYGIIKQQNGYVDVYSEPGKGTTFKIYLPLIEAPAEASAAGHAAVPLRGSETVLLAEDDAAVRSLMRAVLEEFGYSVFEAVNGEEAVRLFSGNGGRIDLVVLDVVMPKMNGKEAYARIREARPGVKVLFTSGYTADIMHKKGILDEGLNFISKPVSPQEFLQKVREVLGPAGDGARPPRS